jgi:hypothetical protein
VLERIAEHLGYITQLLGPLQQADLRADHLPFGLSYGALPSAGRALRFTSGSAPRPLSPPNTAPPGQVATST